MHKRDLAVFGLGHTGLPLLLAFARRGGRVLGLDPDAARVQRLLRGESEIPGFPVEELQGFVESQSIRLTDQTEEITNVRAVIFSVPFGLTRQHTPDAESYTGVLAEIGPFVRPGLVFILERTQYPGAIEEIVQPVLERTSGLQPGRDFHLACLPYREHAGQPGEGPRLIGGLTAACCAAAQQVLAPVFKNLRPTASLRVAEGAHLLEALFTTVNTALANELQEIYAERGINFREALEAAQTKEVGFLPLAPNLGLGGHVAVHDAAHWLWTTAPDRCSPALVEQAAKLNRRRPEQVVAVVAALLNQDRRALRGSRVLVLGLAYKPDSADDTESPSYRLMSALHAGGAVVSYYDPFIPFVRPQAYSAAWDKARSIAWRREELAEFDVVILATAHTGVDYSLLAGTKALFVDTCQALARLLPEEFQARIHPA